MLLPHHRLSRSRSHARPAVVIMLHTRSGVARERALDAVFAFDITDRRPDAHPQARNQGPVAHRHVWIALHQRIHWHLGAEGCGMSVRARMEEEEEGKEEEEEAAVM